MNVHPAIAFLMGVLLMTSIAGYVLGLAKASIETTKYRVVAADCIAVNAYKDAQLKAVLKKTKVALK